jgi:hypothetical protein
MSGLSAPAPQLEVKERQLGRGSNGGRGRKTKRKKKGQMMQIIEFHAMLSLIIIENNHLAPLILARGPALIPTSCQSKKKKKKKKKHHLAREE